MSLVVGAVDRRYIVQENRFGEDTCGICRGLYKFSNRVTLLPCGHIIHRDCFNQYLGNQLMISERGWPQEGTKVECILCCTKFPLDIATFRRLKPFLLRYREMYCKLRYDQIYKMVRDELSPGDAEKLEMLLEIWDPQAQDAQWENTKVLFKNFALYIACGIAWLIGKY